jgi:hypothetical protein
MDHDEGQSQAILAGLGCWVGSGRPGGQAYGLGPT